MYKFNNYYRNLKPEIKEYFKMLHPIFPKFLISFIETETMMRLKDIGYFCNIDEAEKNKLSVLDHSICTALMVWNKTEDPQATLAALFNAAGCPTTTHIMNYLNDETLDNQSIKEVLNKDEELINLLNIFNFKIEEITDFKKYQIVDNNSPKISANRLNRVFLTGLIKSKELNIEQIKEIYENVFITQNKEGIIEFSFKDLTHFDQIIELNTIFNEKDHYSMSIIAELINILITKNIIKYSELCLLTEQQFFNIIKNSLEDIELANLYNEFLIVKENKQNNKSTKESLVYTLYF